ncbi:hypothetical protein COB21_01840 [Candidatus Aerophobetes bacterium]|uniref:Dienelactone hydrolase domain-containing protein n=1 Tax=Aerophobetes bacterium TaxID=2030807 RepID=A0A2A4X6C5_UNCAE|nr:MAG: hypothetical protein COB21_01840 [Candidatus Aerophobetes bacterium]
MENIELNQSFNGSVFKHHLYIDPSQTQYKGVVQIYPAYGGRDSEHCAIAKRFAKWGYMAIAVDIYGEGKIGKNREECVALMTPLIENKPSLIKRLQAFYSFFVSELQFKGMRHAGIGFCFGGMCTLDLARSGTDAALFVSVHGRLKNDGAASCTIKAPVLALHGYKDPFVPFEDVQEFCVEMEHLEADFNMHIFGRAMHSFTNPSADGSVPGILYNQEAEEASWYMIKKSLEKYM